MVGEPGVDTFKLLFELIKALTYDGTNIFNGPHDKLPDESGSDKQVYELVGHVIHGELKALSKSQLDELYALFQRRSG